MLDGLQGRRAEETWRWFIERYRPYIGTCVARIVRPSERAERATDEIWSYLFTSSMIENADRDRRFRTYLAGTVRNYALGWLRKNPSVGDVVPQDLGEAESDPALQFEQEDMRLWKKQVVQLSLDQLGHRDQRQAEVLRWFYGLPSSMDTENGEPRAVSWIANELGIQANLVHQIVFRGRKRLRSCIENELRETVRDAQDLDEELRLVYRVIQEENPGLED
jgi:RNA polymerase sigma factor (sigma-70 family)